MNLTLQRLSESADGPTIGTITNDADGSVMVPVTLELPDRQNQHSVSRIPAGVYECAYTDHPKHGWVYEVLDVPDRSAILLHTGNSVADTEGCVLLGEEQDGDAITESRKAFGLFMAMLTGIDRFTLTVVDVPDK